MEADPNRPEPGAALSVGALTVGSHPVTPGLLLPPSPALGVAFWIAVPAVALLVDAAARRSAGRVANGEEFIRFISTAKWAKPLLVAGWAFAGYHLFAAETSGPRVATSIHGRGHCPTASGPALCEQRDGRTGASGGGGSLTLGLYITKIWFSVF